MTQYFLAYYAKGRDGYTSQGFRLFETTAETPKDIAEALTEELAEIAAERGFGKDRVIATAFNKI